MASLLQNWEDVSSAPVDKVLPTVLALEANDVRERLAAAPPDRAWRVALDIVDEERWPSSAAGMVVAPLLKPGMVSAGADMCISLVEVLSELEQCISVQYATLAYSNERRAASLATAPAQLQLQEGLLMTLQQLFTQVQQQCQQEGEQSSSSGCALGQGSDCPAVRAPSNPTSAPAATGAGPPCRSCQLAHAELLAACSALLGYWPECVLAQDPIAWAWVEAAAECALHMLQDVSTAILQHQQLHADGGGEAQQPAPPADVLQLGLAALDLLAAVCRAAAAPKLGHIVELQMERPPAERGLLDLPCMLPSMIAVGAAAVLGQEMQRRLRRTAAACADSKAGSTAAGAVASSGAGPDAAVTKDHGDATDEAEAYIGSSEGAGHAGAESIVIDAAWRLVCVTEQWAGGQLLPQPFTLLLEALGCSPKAFLMLACIWQQQQQGSSLQAAPVVLENLFWACRHVFWEEFHYTFSDSSSLTASDELLQRLSCCHAKGQHQPQHTQQHLLLALLLMREAVWGSPQPATSPLTARRTLSDPSAKPVLRAASAAASCVSTWLCWAQFEQQQQQEALGSPAAAGEAGLNGPTEQRLSWALGGASSSAVLLELLQGHCRLLQEGARELQAVTSSWVATRSSEKHSSKDTTNSSAEPLREWYAGGIVTDVDHIVKDILRDVLGLLRVLLATAAVDSGVLQQAAPHLFGLAGTLEQLVRLRCACHCDRLVMEVDWYMPQLLHLLLGSLDLSAFAGLKQRAAGDETQLPRAVDAARPGLQTCGLLPYLALAAPLSGQQQRQLLGLLFSCLKVLSAYPVGMYAFSWTHQLQDRWLAAGCDTIRAACAAGRLLLATGGPWVLGVASSTPACSQETAGGSTGKNQHQGQGSTPPGGGAGGQGSSCHSCGLGAEGTAALLPWVVLQGRALQLWVELFRAYVQLPSAAECSKAAAKSSKGQDSHRQPYSLVGSAKAVDWLAAVFDEAVVPSTQLLAVVLEGVAYGGEHPLQRQRLSGGPQVRAGTHKTALMPPPVQQAKAVGRLLYGVPAYLWPPLPFPQAAKSPGSAWLQQQLAKHGQQLRGHCREQGLELSRLQAASGLAAATVLQVLQTLVATSEGLKQLGKSAQEPHRLRQSDVRRYLKSWEVGDAAVLKGVLAMLSGGEHSAAGVAVAAWLCSPSIAGDLLAQLQEFSSQLSTLPIHEACNNPACRIIVGNREQGLVSGKACVCAGCMMGHYCSKACQWEHWPLHQLQCGAVAAAAAGDRKQ